MPTGKGNLPSKHVIHSKNAKTDKALVRKIGKIKRGPPTQLLRNR